MYKISLYLKIAAKGGRTLCGGDYCAIQNCRQTQRKGERAAGVIKLIYNLNLLKQI